MDHDRISQASSVATISYFPVTREGSVKVQTFGKRCQAAKRDPNCPVVIRGWLNKKDSAGLKLWKRRWFVLSNYCLFYYKDSREESVLGSIPLPSYKILFCTPRECKNRKFTFKVVHQGMRSYFFSADTQEDMLGWVRALSQSALMEPDGTLNRRCSSYQDFTKIGGSSESMDLPRPPSDEESPYQKHRHISRTLSEPSRLTGGRAGPSHSDPRGRRSQRDSRTPSPPDSGTRGCGPNQDEDLLATQAEAMGTGSLTSRGQLGSRPHTPVGRVDIRPHDDLLGVPHTLYYTPASPKLEFKSTPTTPVTERWQNTGKPVPIYGSVHHVPAGRRPLGKPPKPRDTLPIRPLESDADIVLTRLCGCDKVLLALSVELAQLQMDKDSVHCALEMSRLQLEDWKNQGPLAQEEALIQKALLQEELVTIRARMCDVSLEMERVWSQYERMESELSVIRSHLQHVCNFGGLQEQSQAQRELWMMEDILSGLKINRDHFRFLLGLQRHHTFQHTVPLPGPPGSPVEFLHGGLPMDVEQEPPLRPPLPHELQEGRHGPQHGWTEWPYEGIYSHAVDPPPRRRNSQPDLLNVKPNKDSFESGSKSNPADTTSQSTKKTRMSEEEQIERMRRNQERLANRKKAPVSAPSGQGEGSEARDEAPFPLRVTRVVTAVLPSTLVARRVSVEDPPAELRNPLPEQIQQETQQRPPVQARKMFSKPPRHLLPESPDQRGPIAKTLNASSPPRDPGAEVSSREPRPGAARAEAAEMSRTASRHQAAAANGSLISDIVTEVQPSALPTPEVEANLCLTPEQREAKLRRVERIRERVIRSAARESACAPSPTAVMGEGKEARKGTSDMARRLKSDRESHHGCGSCVDNQAEVEMDENSKRSKGLAKIGNKTQYKTKVKRPGSPYHVSALTVYQKDGGKGFTSSKSDAEQRAAGGNDGEVSSSDLRAKWFLSTSRWQGCIPLQISKEASGIEEASGAGELLASSDDMAESNEMSPAVSESLEKMKENHSLFYKIACDISISDTDIEKNDGNPNGRTSPGPEGEEEGEEVLVVAESMQKDEAAENTNQPSTQEVAADVMEKDARPQDETLRGEDQSEGNKEDLQEGPAQSDDCVKVGDEDKVTIGRDDGAKESADRKVDPKRSSELRKCSSEENTETVRERGEELNMPSGSVSEDGRGTRSASFGKARLTVLRTSL